MWLCLRNALYLDDQNGDVYVMNVLLIFFFSYFERPDRLLCSPEKRF